MPPFVAQRHRKESDKKETNTDKYEVSILAAAKKSKLSFEELNLLSLNDFFDYIDLFVGTGNEDEVARDATQEDIDAFYSAM